MARNDMRVIGQCSRQPFRVDAGAATTRGYVGDPMINTATYTSGVASANTIVIAADDDVTVVTEQFVGILAKDMEVSSAGLVLAGKVLVDVPFPMISRIEALLTDTTTGDTESEAIGLLNDIYMINMSGSAGSGTYSWSPAVADTAAFQAAWYNAPKALLQCTVDVRGMSRKDIT